MEKLTSKDIEKMDFLLYQMVDWDAHVNMEDLVKAGYYKTSEVALAKADFEHYISHFREKEVGNLVREDGQNTLTPNTRATRFKEEGGFKRYFEEHLKRKSELEAIEAREARKKAVDIENARVQAEMSRKVLRNYGSTRFAAWTAFVIAIILLVLEVLSLLDLIDPLLEWIRANLG